MNVERTSAPVDIAVSACRPGQSPGNAIGEAARVPGLRPGLHANREVPR